MKKLKDILEFKLRGIINTNYMTKLLTHPKVNDDLVKYLELGDGKTIRYKHFKLYINNTSNKYISKVIAEINKIPILGDNPEYKLICLFFNIIDDCVKFVDERPGYKCDGSYFRIT